MHVTVGEKVASTLLFMTVACLPASYVLIAARALRNGRLDITGRGVGVLIVRSEQPSRFAFTAWGLLVSMSLLAAICSAFAILVLVSR